MALRPDTLLNICAINRKKNIKNKFRQLKFQKLQPSTRNEKQVR